MVISPTSLSQLRSPLRTPFLGSGLMDKVHLDQIRIWINVPLNRSPFVNHTVMTPFTVTTSLHRIPTLLKPSNVTARLTNLLDKYIQNIISISSLCKSMAKILHDPVSIRQKSHFGTSQNKLAITDYCQCPQNSTPALMQFWIEDSSSTTQQQMLYLTKNIIHDNYVNFHCVPLEVHWRNSSERDIHTLRNHCIVGLYKVDKNFPIHIWYDLLPQAEIT